MGDWSAGYVADIGYTYGYYTELNPNRAKLALLYQGIAIPEYGVACELGFGQGISANIHAAASGACWYGTDFNPAQAGFAQELAKASGAEAHLYDEAFADFAQRADLPDFDYIGLHGIWSWISDQNRQVIVDFIRRKLKVGGVLYISCNTLPGWAAFAPMRHLMTEHAEVIGSEGRGIVSRIDDAIEFATNLMATNPTFSRANPLVAEKLAKLKDQNRHYLAHEYFNRDWHPMHFATMADWLEPAKVQYAGSAHYIDYVDSANHTPEQQEFLNAIPDPMFRQSTRDFIVNQQFRRDYWIKGARPLNVLDKSELLRAHKVILKSYRDDIPLKVDGCLGEATLNEDVYTPLLDLLADHKPRTLGQLEQAMLPQGKTLAHVVQAVLVMSGAGHIDTVQDDRAITRAKKSTDKLNHHLMTMARGNLESNYLASPVTGGGVIVQRFRQLFLLALKQGHKTPNEWAQFAWKILEAQGQKLKKEGKAVETPVENIAELLKEATEFQDKQLPILKALQIA
ncbi:MAG: class I SAM-dependent methyltransferase [Gammaproteobacteria bacterium]|nr:class I SAM-dependent methyltransferase [Gammaproteobacteria bacterium]